VTAAPAPGPVTKLPLRSEDFARRCLPFYEARVLDLASIHTVDLLAQGAGVHDPDLLLGLAFAVRAPSVGHVGVDLATIRTTLIVEEAAGRPELRERIEALQWPGDEAGWHERVAACALVTRTPDANGPARPFVDEGGLVMPHRYWNYQHRLALALAERARSGAPGIGVPPEAVESLDPSELQGSLASLFPDARPDDRQRLAAVSACLRGLTIISGGPGTGKTYTVKKLLAVLWQQWMAGVGHPPRAALVAPTGKAVVRMREALAQDLDALPIAPETRAWIGARVPTTLHRLLGYQPGSPTRFRHDPDSPLPIDLLVVDEASMVDLPLMCKLIEATPRHARVLLLGDREQLASVGAGSVLADITSGIGPQGIRYSPAHARAIADATAIEVAAELCDDAAPPIADGIVQFIEPHRSRPNSGVQQTAYAISDERLETAAAWLTGEAAEQQGPFEDLAWHGHTGRGLAEAALEEILNTYAGPGSYLERLYAGPANGETPADWLLDVLARLDRVRVLSAHREGTLGVSGLNATIADALRESHPGRVQREAGSSDWHGRPILLGENRHDLGLMNGDVGILVRDGGGLRAVFAGSEPGSLVRHVPTQLPHFETVFAMTVHKSQGSEFGHTVLVLPNSRSPILTRELIYTALTRARQRITLCGSREVLQEGLERTVTRASSLGRLLWR